MPFWAARGKRVPKIEMNEANEANRREKRSAAERDVVHAGQRFRNRPARPAPQAADPFWAARGKKSSNRNFHSELL